MDEARIKSNEILRLYTTQCRLRHLKGLSARNVDVSSENRIGLYFTMHSDERASEFYRSELVQNTTNPNWTNFNWATLSEQLNTALPSVVLKLWQTSRSDQLITEQRVVFKELHYLGEQVPKDGVRFKQNTFAFEMFDGLYACSSSVWKTGRALSVKETDDLNFELVVHKRNLRKSYDLNTLKRVRTVQRALKQTRAAVQTIRDRVHSTLAPTLKTSQMIAKRKTLNVRLEQLRDELHYHRQQLEHTRQRCSNLIDENRLKGVEIGVSVRMLRKSKDDLIESWRNLIDARENLVKTSAQLIIRRRQLISELGFIYPIREASDKRFTICGVHLPNSEDFSGHDEIMISISLGYACHMVAMVSQFLQVPTRYPVQHGGSRSKIQDHFLSTIPDTDREFPLYTRGADKLHFQYGVYLLNKNIAQFRYYCGYPTHDLRCTLLNLRTLLELRPISKTEPTTPASIAEPRSMPIITKHKDPHQSNENNIDGGNGSIGSLDLQGSLSHRRPLFRPSPECCRPATLSVSLDHGLDELIDGCSSCSVVATTPHASSSTELRENQPSSIQLVDDDQKKSKKQVVSALVSANGTAGSSFYVNCEDVETSLLPQTINAT